MVQVPALTMDAVVPETVQTVLVVEAKAIAVVELVEVALKAKVPP